MWPLSLRDALVFCSASVGMVSVFSCHHIARVRVPLCSVAGNLPAGAALVFLAASSAVYLSVAKKSTTKKFGGFFGSGYKMESMLQHVLHFENDSQSETARCGIFDYYNYRG